ncbi:serine hydrolase domain-containing protein [Erwinia pyri]|uniref:Serine hydrolase domain-containing protein n=1 Tax=Erwinia pyri TaxID=3062598 RepID=A0AA50HNS6_9GAMM|nr:serine hydrolase domain-containing protein [Erwinia sp. DE2]WLS79597.1 serine hydrolase domain-containing protein [Erwinia sp. DE2]
MTPLKPLLLCWSLLLGGCASLSSNSIDSSPQASLVATCHVTVKQQIDALALPLINSHRTPGVVVALLHHGQRQVFSYGFTDTDRLIPMSGDTLFAVGSVTKGFTAESAALLVEQGKLKWSSTLRETIGKEVSLSRDAGQITLLQLATHTSGLPRQMTTLHMLSRLSDYLFTGHPFYDDLDRGEFLDYLPDFQRPAHHEVVYSNLGYSILDYVITQQSGQTPQAIARQQIIAPLGMTHTGYHPEILPGYPSRARGHAGDQPKFMRRGEAVPDWHFTGYMVGAASLWSSANDLLSYLAAHLNGSGDASLDRAFKDATTVRFRQPEYDSSALAWLSNDFNAQSLLYQSGFIGGFASYIGMDIRHKTAIVVLQNSFNWDNDIGHRMLLRLASSDDGQAACQP